MSLMMSVIELFGDKAPFEITGNIRINCFEGWSEETGDRLTTIWEGQSNCREMPPYACWHCQVTVMNVTDDGWLEIEFDAGDVDWNP